FDLSIFNVHPFLDLAGMGQAVLAYADGDRSLACEAADAVAAHLWDLRGAFDAELPDLSKIFAEVESSGRGDALPVVIGDQGESVLAGAPGDSMDIIGYGLQHSPELSGFAAVYDPDAVAQADELGTGMRAEFRLGAAVSASLQPLQGQMLIERMTDGHF